MKEKSQGLDPDSRQRPVRRRRGIYLLPNLLTTGTLFGAFYAIVAAMGGEFQHAAQGILGAMIADSLDGRIARLTNTSSDFGKEYDSLCDMAAFGIASGIVVYAFSLHGLSDYRWMYGKLGGVISFAYAACAALRLARFNVHTAIASSNKDFFGLPSPAAAAIVVFFVWSAAEYGYDGSEAGIIALASVITLLAAGLMVSSFRYSSFKQINVSGKVRFATFVAVIGVLTLIAIDPPRILFLLFFSYALSGPTMALWRRFKGHSKAGESASTP